MTTAKVLHILQNASFDAGGLSRAVLPLCQALGRREELRVELIAGLVDPQTLVSDLDDAVELHVARYQSSRAAIVASAHIRTLEKRLSSDKPDLVHLHSLWLPLITRAIHHARRNGAKVVLSPHGTLEPWSLNWHRARKSIALALYQRRDLESVDGFFATSDAEADAIRSLGFRQPIFVIPNGIDMEHDNLRKVATNASGEHSVPRRLLSLGRIHPKKGLANLIHAWNQARPQGWILQIAGVDNGGHRLELEQLVHRLNLSSSVEFSGPILDEAKIAVYRGATAFILPSFSENFGIVVAEALANGLPVIATHGTPWRSLEERGCGWWVAPTSQAIAGAMREMAALSDGRYREMQAAAEELAKTFSWADIAARTSDAYSSLLKAAS